MLFCAKHRRFSWQYVAVGAVLCFFLVFTGCTRTGPKPAPERGSAVEDLIADVQATRSQRQPGYVWPPYRAQQQQVQSAAQPRRVADARPRRDVTQIGSDRLVASPAGRAGGPLTQISSGGAISLNLVDASIADAANAVLGDALGLNYVIESGVSGQITLQTTTPLPRDALLDAFQTALEFNGATLAESGGLVTILPVDRAAPRFVSARDRRGLGRQIVIIPLRYISTQEMVRLLEPVVAQNAILWVSERRNLLMVTGNRNQLDAILEAVNLFDVDVLQGKSIALVRLKAVSPDQVAKELETVFETGEGGSLQGVVDFIPNERLGSILVISSRARYISRAKQWIEELDATAGQTQRYSQVYNLQNRTAEDLQPILSELVASGQTEPTADGELPPTLIEGQAKVVADNINNAVIVFATQDEHDSIGRLIRQLDSTPTQVLLEATIAEVTLNDELDFGVRWFFESGEFSIAFSDLASGATGANFPGFSFLFDSVNARIALNALSSITDVDIVSSPSVLVLDNREAELRVGDQVPVATRSATNVIDPNAPVVNSITLRDTGIILRVKPRVSESGRVVMDIEQEVSDVQETTSSGIDSPTISQRLIKTSVVVDDGQTLALGGLIQDSQGNIRTKVPLLGDIPIIGRAFSSTESNDQRSELLILITPKVIRNAGEGRRITDEFRERLSAPDALLGTARQRAGQRHQLDRLLN